MARSHFKRRLGWTLALVILGVAAAPGGVAVVDHLESDPAFCNACHLPGGKPLLPVTGVALLLVTLLGFTYGKDSAWTFIPVRPAVVDHNEITATAENQDSTGPALDTIGMYVDDRVRDVSLVQHTRHS